MCDIYQNFWQFLFQKCLFFSSQRLLLTLENHSSDRTVETNLLTVAMIGTFACDIITVNVGYNFCFIKHILIGKFVINVGQSEKTNVWQGVSYQCVSERDQGTNTEVSEACHRGDKKWCRDKRGGGRRSVGLAEEDTGGHWTDREVMWRDREGH